MSCTHTFKLCSPPFLKMSFKVLQAPVRRITTDLTFVLNAYDMMCRHMRLFNVKRDYTHTESVQFVQPIRNRFAIPSNLRKPPSQPSHRACTHTHTPGSYRWSSCVPRPCWRRRRHRQPWPLPPRQQADPPLLPRSTQRSARTTHIHVTFTCTPKQDAPQLPHLRSHANALLLSQLACVQHSNII
jgi:hypothetical protein